MPFAGVMTHEGEDTYYECSSCGYMHSGEAEATECCGEHFCEHCDSEYNNEEEAINCCAYGCPNCGDRHNSQYDADMCCPSEEEDIEPEIVHSPDTEHSTGSSPYPRSILEQEPEYMIYVPDLEDRPARPCSVEQELSGGGRLTATLMYDLGVSDHNEMQSYSREINASRVGVKEDSTLPSGGGEVVYSRFNLSEGKWVKRMSKVVAAIRRLKDEGMVSTDTAAGTHIHIGARPYNGEASQVFGPNQMTNLYEIFSFAEDVVFRLAAAGWNEHRGRRYSDRLNKFDKVTAGRVAMGSQRHRYFSINFQRLLKAAATCSCGACLVGDWAECDCGCLESGTVEWRVFNATTKPETLHAWLLLAHGITAASFTHTIDTLTPNTFEEADTENHPWILGWLLWNCPFTDWERQVIIDVAKRSPGLNINWEEFDAIHEPWVMDIPDWENEPELPPIPDRYEARHEEGSNVYYIYDLHNNQSYNYSDDQTVRVIQLNTDWRRDQERIRAEEAGF